jgi:hypothetical protein
MSKNFKLKTHPSAMFSLYLHWSKHEDYVNCTPSIGVVANSVTGVDDLKLCVKLWLENAGGFRFNEQTGKLHV